MITTDEVQAAIARHFAESHGGEFTTEQFRENLAHYRAPKPKYRNWLDHLVTVDEARWFLGEHSTVIAIGPDRWLATDSTWEQPPKADSSE